MHMIGFRIILTLVLICTSGIYAAADDTAGENAVSYQSPYSVQLPYPVRELIPDLLEGERGDARFESKIRQSEWYQYGVGPWGPLPRNYPPPNIAQGKSSDWKRARILATALRFVGYHYRHHHIPDWAPPPGWHIPKPGSPRHDGKGVDCSNFTSFVYNQGLGIGFSSDIHKQADMETATVHGSEEEIPVRIIPLQDSPEAWARILKPGDLLFIRPRGSETISHVVIWIGEWSLPQGLPLVLDSHGSDVRDADGTLIPDGVYLRPFRPNSWYAVRADHAIRIIGE